MLLNNFPTIYSFDTEDCKNFGFKLRPLFYTEKKDVLSNKDIDVSFIGTEHSDRLDKLRKLKKICIDNRISFYLRLKTTMLPLLKARINASGYNSADLDILTRRPLTYEEVMNITKRSKCVVDFSHPKQCGLTMRTIETFAMGCRLITSNKYIKEYLDLHPSWYLVIDENTNVDDILFFIKSFKSESPQSKSPMAMSSRSSF